MRFVNPWVTLNVRDHKDHKDPTKHLLHINLTENDSLGDKNYTIDFFFADRLSAFQRELKRVEAHQAEVKDKASAEVSAAVKRMESGGAKEQLKGRFACLLPFISLVGSEDWISREVTLDLTKKRLTIMRTALSRPYCWQQLHLEIDGSEIFTADRKDGRENVLMIRARAFIVPVPHHTLRNCSTETRRKKMKNYFIDFEEKETLKMWQEILEEMASESGAGAESESEAGAEPESEAGAESESGAGAESESEAGAEPEPEA